MSRSANWSNGHHNGSNSAEVVGLAPAAQSPRTTVVRSPWLRLSRGMAINAAIEARLLGKRVLTLNADVRVLPVESVDADAGVVPRPTAKIRNDSRGRLVEAAQALEAVAADLRKARDRMP